MHGGHLQKLQNVQEAFYTASILQSLLMSKEVAAPEFCQFVELVIKIPRAIEIRDKACLYFKYWTLYSTRILDSQKAMILD